MHDPHTLLAPDNAAQQRLARKGYALDRTALSALVRERAEAIATRDNLRAELNAISRRLRGSGTDEDSRRAGVEAARELKERIRKAEHTQRTLDAELKDVLLGIPNTPLDEVPDGTPDDPVVEVRRWGQPPRFDFTPRDHVELGTTTGILDLERAGKLSGTRFAVTVRAGARLERALASFLLDLHTGEHGYHEYSVPHLVTRETMTGTGQLPKFEADLFRTQVDEDRDLYLIPTAEVPLVNLFRGETLPAADLPLALTAHTACFRSEAGSYGRDTRGLIRLHQFAKVELVRLCTQQDAADQLQLMLSHAEECLKRLGLHYRVIELRAGDLGFSARRTYDLEVWLPSQGTFREISSVSDCGPFQARRAGIQVRQGAGREYPATLNGSGLPIGRTMVAILEQYQQADGSVIVPPALVPYAGFSRIGPDGACD
ncbi:serine--tRNA ligase [Streptomyces abikoensis]|uniref:serine--tRNA ligase n=1 Tax=Streptomyces abikoensis TaxID=97398 RepID=UPI003685546F